MQRRIHGALLGAIALCLVSACRSQNSTSDGKGETSSGKTAMATFVARPDSPISGTITFTQADKKVKMVAILAGVPEGTHGFHIHEKGDCSAPDFSSAGPHFNPGGKAHACPSGDAHHAGDFGNIVIGADGTGRLEVNSEDLAIGEGPNSVVGKAVVLHEKKDDCSSQPAGDSGKRIACAVIQVK